ncbi:MFS transporter [Streptomyces sp. HNM0574]|uniref:MFS transporter n=1 Tax=Streptomyces sp. HNM0574 TaxID=2714954 RepID=UPI00146D1080|nr:MFS transporter [Streptomyces sp. HNM0574]NLU68560.1 MFS transporter [Streptomyces sp. HNM0574]
MTTTHSHPGARLRLWSLLFVLAGNMLIDALEVSVVLPALPATADGLGLSLWGVHWVMSGFALGFGGLLLLGPRITSRFGRRRVYLTALAVFVLASVAGGLADSGAVLVLTRVVKGACAALTAPAGLAIITTVFPEGPRQRRAVSVYSLFGAAGFAVGLLLSGALTALSWRGPLLFPAAAALVLLPLAWRLIPDEPARAARPPLLPARVLRDGPLLRSALGAATLNGSYLALLLTAVFALHTERGWAPWQTALAFLPACLPLVGSALLTPRMVQRHGTRRLIALGALAALLGHLWLLAGPGPGTYATGLLPTLLLVGAAFVGAFGALNMQATSGIPAADRGLAVPLYQTGVQLGAVVSLTTTAALLTAAADERPALYVITALGALGLLTALAGRRRPDEEEDTRR